MYLDSELSTILDQHSPKCKGEQPVMFFEFTSLPFCINNLHVSICPCRAAC